MAEAEQVSQFISDKFSRLMCLCSYLDFLCQPCLVTNKNFFLSVREAIVVGGFQKFQLTVWLKSLGGFH